VDSRGFWLICVRKVAIWLASILTVIIAGI
jgi:hypothetical protein